MPSLIELAFQYMDAGIEASGIVSTILKAAVNPAREYSPFQTDISTVFSRSVLFYCIPTVNSRIIPEREYEPHPDI